MSALKVRGSVFGLLASFGFALLAMPAGAHHSVALQFDMTKHITITGTIAGIDWRNPHAWLHVDVEDEQGNVERWNIEYSNANSLFRRGWRREDLPIGETVTITGLPARDGSNAMGEVEITMADGSELFEGSGPAARAAAR